VHMAVHMTVPWSVGPCSLVWALLAYVRMHTRFHILMTRMQEWLHLSHIYVIYMTMLLARFTCKRVALRAACGDQAVR